MYISYTYISLHRKQPIQWSTIETVEKIKPEQIKRMEAEITKIKYIQELNKGIENKSIIYL